MQTASLPLSGVVGSSCANSMHSLPSALSSTLQPMTSSLVATAAVAHPIPAPLPQLVDTSRRMSYTEGHHAQEVASYNQIQYRPLTEADLHGDADMQDSAPLQAAQGTVLELQDEASLIRQTEHILGVDWELLQEIWSGLLKAEKKHRVYNEASKYLKHRRVIVDWMCEVGEEYKLIPLTIHCAVRYLDRVLGTLDVAKNRLQLVAMSCILIAAKYEEAEEAIPSLQELNECSNNAYTVDGLKEMEVSVLRHLNWCLSLVTPIHFLHFFQARGIVFENDLFEGGPSNRKSALKYVKKYADFFAELCLQEYSFQQYLPSVMAAAVVAAARRAVKIDPIWNQELEGLTTYNERHIFKAYQHLYSYYTESFPTAPHAYPSPRSVMEFEARAVGAFA